MVRTQIQLTDEQARCVKRIAAERQVSMATVIRQGVDLLLRSVETAATDDERIERAISVAGQFRSGGGDGTAQHDLHLQEAYRRRVSSSIPPRFYSVLGAETIIIQCPSSRP